ncbi:GTP-binding protein EngA [Thioploca ingrica]|uniref:GTPase Der n=1 Tax=Thioploca ingrica TaxID=40754 RepID=A0A090AMN2_9GAMM|nr:GTP-binding protein EngA [Thioploca ingrica]
MLPTFAIVGRPNVGKSTLFNVLTKTRNAIVANEPSLTRDRQVGRGHIGTHDYWVIDTGGLEGEPDAMNELITQHAWLAIQEAQGVLFLVDGRSGLTAVDENIAGQLRRFNIPIHLVINKAENLLPELVSAEFQLLGLENIHTISAAHRWGIDSLMESVLAPFPPSSNEAADISAEEGIKIAIVGRPNVGKSTLVNRLLGYERVITFDQPGTTRDSIFVPFEREGQRYTLIDTAGVRRRAKVFETIEKFSVIKALQAIEAAHVVIMVLDAQEGMTDQDAHLLGHILTSGRALVIAINKWDGLEPSHREQVRYHLGRKLHFVNFAQIHYISALHGSGVGQLLGAVNTAWQAAHQPINTAQLNQVLHQAIKNHPPPLVRGRPIKLRYIHQGGHHPPVFVIHGNQVNALPDSYQRYLINTFREVFALAGTPIRLELKSGTNPYEDRKNILTPRQQRKRQRLLQYVKKK